MKAAIKKLAGLGIMTAADLDSWIRRNQRTDRFGNAYLPSRFQAFTELVGEKQATNILHELANLQCA